MVAWCEKYRPKGLSECVLSQNIKKSMYGFIHRPDNIPNLIFSGQPGTGKTSLAKVIPYELDAESIFINGSLEGNIDTLRNRIQDFVTTASFQGKLKFVILDEADNLTRAVQPALRSFTEQHTQRCRFILTCNYINNIIEPLQDRFKTFHFSYSDKECIQYYERLLHILTTEQVTFKDTVVAKFAYLRFPAMRKGIIELQSYFNANGIIDAGILSQKISDTMLELKPILDKKFAGYDKLVEWVETNNDLEFDQLCIDIFEWAKTSIKKENLPFLIVILNNYQEKHSRVADKKINTLAMFTELIRDCL